MLPKPPKRQTVPLKPATTPQGKSQSLKERLLASGAKPGTFHGAHILGGMRKPPDRQ